MRISDWSSDVCSSDLQFQVRREDQDAFAFRSQQKCKAATERGRLAREIVAVEVPGRKGQVTVVDTDEHPRPETTLEALARLGPPLRKPGRTVTAGNARGVNAIGRTYWRVRGGQNVYNVVVGVAL